MQKKKILVIDDSKVIRAQTTDILLRNGYNVSSESDGESGLENAKQNKYDLILLDVVMPGMSGFELIKNIKLHDTNKSTPIIFLTGVGDQENLVYGFQLGAKDYILKPFSEEVLLARIDIQLKLMSSLQTLEKEIKEKEALVKIAERDNTELLRANVLKERLIALLAHDIKNPVSSIAGMTDLLIDNYERYSMEDIKEIISLIHASTIPISELIDNILIWADKSRIHDHYYPKQFRLKDVIDKCIEINKLYSQSKNISVTSLVDDKVIVYADENMISTVIRNLMSNAIKYNEKGGEVSISSHLVNLVSGDYQEITVEDTGIGINPETIPFLFGALEIDSMNGTNNEKGIGLGLKVCKEYVNKNSGEIHVESEKSKGSKFIFTLPIHKLGMS